MTNISKIDGGAERAAQFKAAAEAVRAKQAAEAALRVANAAAHITYKGRLARRSGGQRQDAPPVGRNKKPFFDPYRVEEQKRRESANREARRAQNRALNEQFKTGNRKTV